MFPTGKVAKYCIFSTKSRAVLYGDKKHEKIPKAIQKVNKIGVQLTRFDQNLLDKFKPFGHSRDISAILSHLRKTSQYDYNFPRQHGHHIVWSRQPQGLWRRQGQSQTSGGRTSIPSVRIRRSNKPSKTGQTNNISRHR